MADLDHVPRPQSSIAHVHLTVARPPGFRSGSAAEHRQAGGLAGAPGEQVGPSAQPERRPLHHRLPAQRGEGPELADGSVRVVEFQPGQLRAESCRERVGLCDGISVCKPDGSGSFAAQRRRRPWSLRQRGPDLLV